MSPNIEIRDIKRLLLVITVFILFSFGYVWLGLEGRIYFLAYFFVVIILLEITNRLLWPNRKVTVALKELWDNSVSFRWTLGFVAFLGAANLAASLWKPFDYIMIPFPAIVLGVLLIWWRRRRAQLSP